MGSGIPLIRQCCLEINERESIKVLGYRQGYITIYAGGEPVKCLNLEEADSTISKLEHKFTDAKFIGLQKGIQDFFIKHPPSIVRTKRELGHTPEIQKDWLPATSQPQMFQQFVSVPSATSRAGEIIEIIEGIPLIRLIFGNFRGVGNMSATYSVYIRLKELGYKGQFEFLFHDNSEISKLRGIHPELNNPDKIGITMMVMQDPKRADVPYCPLTFSCACDVIVHPHDSLVAYNTGCFVQLTPYAWRPNNRLIISIKSSIPLQLPIKEATIYCNGAAGVFTESLEHLFALQEQDKCLIQSLYGLYPDFHEGKPTGSISPLLILDRLLWSIRNVTSNNIVFLLHNQIEVSRDKVFTLDQTIVDINSQHDEKQKVYYVFMDRVPQEVFSLIQKKCKLPAIAEGCSSISELESSGTPFLHGGGTFSFSSGPGKFPSDDQALCKIQNTHLLACETLRVTSASSLDPLYNFIRLCLEKPGDVSVYFQFRETYFISNMTDLVASSLLAANELGLCNSIEDCYACYKQKTPEAKPSSSDALAFLEAGAGTVAVNPRCSPNAIFREDNDSIPSVD